MINLSSLFNVSNLHSPSGHVNSVTSDGQESGSSNEKRDNSCCICSGLHFVQVHLSCISSGKQFAFQVVNYILINCARGRPVFFQSLERPCPNHWSNRYFMFSWTFLQVCKSPNASCSFKGRDTSDSPSRIRARSFKITQESHNLNSACTGLDMLFKLPWQHELQADHWGPRTLPVLTIF